jgi:transposase
MIIQSQLLTGCKATLPANKAGLSIVHIAPYSPELNIIEIVWRKIKFEWMPFSAYTSFKNLKESLYEILVSIGKSAGRFY